MLSAIVELYAVAQEYARNPRECSASQYYDALCVIEAVENDDYKQAIAIGLVF
jgi:hypothetical protein